MWKQAKHIVLEDYVLNENLMYISPFSMFFFPLFLTELYQYFQSPSIGKFDSKKFNGFIPYVLHFCSM